MATTMFALTSPSIRHGEFIKLTTSVATYTFCNAAAPITVNGTTFSGLGDLLQLSDVQRDIKATSDDLTINLTGIDSNNISIILSNTIKGSIVEVWRGFFDSNNQILNTPTQQFFKRYQGIVNSVSISEDFNEQLRTRVATCVVSCASFRQILENLVNGIRTNPSPWKQIYPNDKSMDRTPIIQNQYFDFGGPPKTGSQSATEADAPQQSQEGMNGA